MAIISPPPRRPGALTLARCPDCGRPCVRWRGASYCLRCSPEPLLDHLRDAREVRR